MPASISLDASPFTQFQLWMAEAESAEPTDPNAMILATATPQGRPAARTVLLKGFDQRGFVFYTNTTSRKGDEITVNPYVALLLYWKSLGRQIRIEGAVSPVDDTEADAYYATRARISRLGAWASEQSRPLANRTILEDRLAEVEQRYPDEVPRPDHWSGYRVQPTSFEFWQEMPFRLHDRTLYQPGAGGTWTQSKLFP